MPFFLVLTALLFTNTLSLLPTAELSHDFLSLPIAEQERRFSEIPRSNTKHMLHEYICWNAQLRPRIMIESLDPAIDRACITTVIKKQLEIWPPEYADPKMVKRFSDYMNAYKYITKEFFTKKRDISSLTINDLKMINGYIVGEGKVSPLRTIEMLVVRHPFSNISELESREKRIEFGKFTPAEEEKLAEASEKGIFKELANNNPLPFRTLYATSPEMRSVIAKVYDCSPPKTTPEILAKLTQALEIAQTKPMHPIALAAYLFNAICLIHPFLDANGRTALLIANLVLVKHGYLPILCGETEYNKAFSMVVDSIVGERVNHDSMIQYFAEQIYIMEIFWFCSKENLLSRADLEAFKTMCHITPMYSTHIHPEEAEIRARLKSITTYPL